MNAGTYEAESRVEADHWWFVARRALLNRRLTGSGANLQGRILDLGTSTGTNLRMLQEMACPDVTGLDFSEDAIRFCHEKGLGRVVRGDICNLPFDDASFDVVLATDIIDHVNDDWKAMEEIERVLRPGGLALITVPAFASLWGLQDIVSMHKRRYRMNEMLALARGARLLPQKAFYFNFALFLPIWFARQLIRIFDVKIQSENELNSPWVNRILKAIFRLDTIIAERLPIPFGVSILLQLEKPAILRADLGSTPVLQ